MCFLSKPDNSRIPARTPCEFISECVHAEDTCPGYKFHAITVESLVPVYCVYHKAYKDKQVFKSIDSI